MKIINNTGYVVTVFNSNFNKDIAIGESLIITDEELYGNFELCFKYFFVKKSEVNEEWKWVSGARGGHYSYSYNKEKYKQDHTGNLSHKAFALTHQGHGNFSANT